MFESIWDRKRGDFMWGEEASKALARLEESLGKIGGLVDVGAI